MVAVLNRIMPVLPPFKQNIEFRHKFRWADSRAIGNGILTTAIEGQYLCATWGFQGSSATTLLGCFSQVRISRIRIYACAPSESGLALNNYNVGVLSPTMLDGEASANGGVEFLKTVLSPTQLTVVDIVPPRNMQSGANWIVNTSTKTIMYLYTIPNCVVEFDMVCVLADTGAVAAESIATVGTYAAGSMGPSCLDLGTSAGSRVLVPINSPGGTQYN